MILLLEKKYKIVVPLFGAAYAAPNKGTTILYNMLHQVKAPEFYTDLGLQKVLNPPVYGKIQELFKAFECFFKYFSRQI